MLELGLVLIAFAIILVCYRLKLGLAASILVGAVALGVLFGQPAGDLAAAAVGGAIKPDTVALVIVTMLLLWLSKLMDHGGQLKRIVEHFQQLVRRPSLSMAAMPALVGLLPMPGGALFSAPMVRHAVGDTHVSGGTLSAVNYWFRHPWEYWWPLYPGVILAITLTDTQPGRFILLQMPLSVFMIVGGLVFAFRGLHPELHQESATDGSGRWGAFLRETSSIWVIIAVFAPVALGLRWAPEGFAPSWLEGALRRYGPITAGLLVSLIWTIRLSRIPWRSVLQPLRGWELYGMALLVLAVMVFENVLHSVDAAQAISQGLAEAHVPVIVVIALLPFVSGMVTGVAIGFVGTAFPIVVGLVKAMPGEPDMMPYVVLAYGLGHMGQMLSPLHLCHVLSNKYFGTGFGPVYKHLVPAAITAGCLTTLYFVVLQGVLNGG
jgi:uncharacterized protein